MQPSVGDSATRTDGELQHHAAAKFRIRVQAALVAALYLALPTTES